MASRALSILLAFSLVLASPGAGGWLVFAEGSDSTRTYTDPQTQKTELYGVKREAAPAPAAEDVIAKLRADPRVAKQVPKGQLEQAVKLLRRYGDNPEAAGALQDFSRDLKDPSKDTNLSLAALFDRMTDFARRTDAGGTYTSVVSQTDKEQELAVKSSILNTTLYTQKSTETGYNTHVKTITRRDPEDPGNQIIDQITEETEKGAATDSHVIYNRRVHELFRSLKSQYYDQVDLSRQIKEGEQGKDPKITPQALKKMKRIWAKNRQIFSDQAPHLLEYLQKLDEKREDKTLGQLRDWKEAEEMQREAQRFSNGRQLEMMQKSVIAQLSNYFSQVTNCSPKEKKGEEALDATQKKITDLQDTLSEFEKGHLEAFGPLMTKIFKYTKLSHEDQKFVTPELMNAASEAFAYVAAAQKAQHRAMDHDLSPEEVDAAVEESGKWLQLAQIQLMYFDTASAAIQLERLKAGELRDHLGLDDPKMKAQALKLAKVAREQYLKKIKKADSDLKKTLLKQCIATFYMTYRNAAGAYLFTETLQDRVKALSAKATQIKMLYLALRFDAYKRNFKGYSALAKVEGKVYAHFLAHLPEEEAANARALDQLSKSLADMAKTPSAEAIRDGLAPKDEEFKAIVARLDPDSPDIPDLDEVNRDSSDLSIKQSQLFGAVQTFTAQMRVFDEMNELDLYLRKYASSEMVSSESDGLWSQFVSFKWMDSWIGNVGGGRDAAAAGMMENNPLTKGFFKKFRLGRLGVPKPLQDMLVTGEAYKKLGDREKRQAVLNLLADGKFNQALARIEKLDPKAAAKALRDYEAAKTPDDPFDRLDFDSFMNKTTDDKALIKAQGVLGSLFDQLQPYIMGYTLSSAVYDIGLWSVVTAGAGFFYESYIATGKAVQAAAKAYEASRIVKAMREFETLHKIVVFPARVLNYVGKVVRSWGDGLKQVLDIKEIVSGWQIPKKFAASWVNAVHHTFDNTKGMSIASGGMTAVQHWMNPETSQYKDAGDAFWQGMAGGFAFGAKAGMLTIHSVVPARALGDFGAFGKLMNEFAQSPGPVSSMISGTARALGSTSSLARNGVFGAAQLAAEGTAYKTAVGILSWGWGMADGAAKYWLAAELPRWGAETAYFAYRQSQGDNSGKVQNGATSYVHDMAEANTFGQGLAQISWLLVPTNEMYSYSQMREQTDTYTAVNRALRNRQLGDFLAAANGDKVGVQLKAWDQPFRQLFSLSWPKARTVEVTMDEQVRDIVLRKSVADRSIGELAAASFPNLETYGGRQELAGLKMVLAGKEPPAAEAPRDPAQVLEAARHRARSGSPLAESERLYAVFSKDGKLLEVVPGKAKPKGDVVLAITAKGDGTFKVGEKSPAKLFGKGGYKRAQAALEEASAKLAKPPPVRADEVFRTQESVALIKETLAEKLAGDGATRKKIIDAFEAKQDHVELPDGVKASGKMFEQLVQAAWQAQSNATEYGLRPALKALASLIGEKPELKFWNTISRGGLWQVLTGQPVMDKGGRRMMEVMRGAEKRLAGADGASPAERLKSLREWAGKIEQGAKGPDAQALKPFMEALRGEGSPETVLTNAKTELGGLIENLQGGVKDSTLADYDKRLQGKGEAKDNKDVKAALDRLGSLRDRAIKERRIDDVGRLNEVIDALGQEGAAGETVWTALEEMLGLTAGAPADLLELWKLKLGAKSPLEASAAVHAVLERVEAIERADAARSRELEPLAGALKGKGSPQEIAQAARAEIDKLLDRTAGASAKDLKEVGTLLNRALDFQAKYDVDAVREAAKKENEKAFKPLIDALGKKATPEQSLGAALDLARSYKRSVFGGPKAQMDGLIAILEKDAPAADVLKEALSYLRKLDKKASAQDASSLARLKDLLGGDLRAQDRAKLGREVIGGMRDKTRGESRGTLESLLAHIEGKRTADAVDAALSATMKDMVEQAGSPETKAALKGLSRSIIALAAARFGADGLVRGIKAYRAGGSPPAFKDAKDLHRLIWERVIFGQMFKESVDKDGQRAWDIPADLGIKDAKGDPIKSFREGQLRALDGVFDMIAGAKSKGERGRAVKQIYALLETSGGKTLLGFVLINFMEAYARDQGKQGAYYVTANADLVNQARDVYGAMFKGRKPSFEVITYSDLMVKQAQSQATGSLSPFQTHEVYLDEFDTVGLGTPLSLGQFNGAFSFPEIDPVQLALRAFVHEAGLLTKGEKLPEGVKKTLHERFGGKSVSRDEFQWMLELTPGHQDSFVPGFKEAWQEYLGRAHAAVDRALRDIKKGDFLKLITDDYCKKMGMSREEIYEKFLREHKNGFGSFFTLGVLEAKYGDVHAWVDKVLEGAFEAASEGELLDTLYQRDPKRRQIISFHNDQALDSLDTHYRSALELREGVPVTLDFSHVAVTDFRTVVQAATEADALAIAASGTLPDRMRTFFTDEMGWGIVGEGSNPAKVLNLVPRIFGNREEMIRHAAKETAKNIREGNNIDFHWVPSEAVKEMLLEALKQEGISLKEEVSEFTKPGYAYFTKDRYMFELETARNVEGFKTGKVKVVILVGQGGLRGLEAPLGLKYEGAKIRMYVHDSHLLADVSLLQLLGRIDAGRIPKGAITSFHLLDNEATMIGNKAYNLAARRKIIDAAQGLDQKRFVEALEIIRNDPGVPRGRPMTDEAIFELLKKPTLQKAKDLYRDFMTLRRLREVVGDEKLARAVEDPKVMQEVLASPEVLQVIASEMRRIAEKNALQSSGLIKELQQLVPPQTGAPPAPKKQDLEPVRK